MSGFKYSRRYFMSAALSGAAVLCLSGFARAEEEVFPVQKTEEEWKKILTPEQFRILRKHGTEPAFSSPLNEEKHKGEFHCAACDNLLYTSAAKFDSGTGWPSFWQPADDGAIGTSTDFKLIYPRTEVHCADCGGHLGHVFKDGPQPTGLRYCMNGAAMTFKPTE